LPLSFYQSEDVLGIAKGLLGKQLWTNIDGVLTAGTIVETEAYRGIDDKASHAYKGLLTDRTSTMYQLGGIAYIYLCYGIHSLFNVVTGPKGTPHAVLIRAIEPVKGLDMMLQRRKMDILKPNITRGPGAMTQAMGISRAFNASNLQDNSIWIAETNFNMVQQEIVACPRIGVAYAGEDALLPWRFYLKGNVYVSRPIKGNG